MLFLWVDSCVCQSRMVFCLSCFGNHAIFATERNRICRNQCCFVFRHVYTCSLFHSSKHQANAPLLVLYVVSIMCYICVFLLACPFCCCPLIACCICVQFFRRSFVPCFALILVVLLLCLVHFTQSVFRAFYPVFVYFAWLWFFVIRIHIRCCSVSVTVFFSWSLSLFAPVLLHSFACRNLAVVFVCLRYDAIFLIFRSSFCLCLFACC